MSVVNEIDYTYDDTQWNSLTVSEQSHDGATTGSKPKVQYAYEDGSGAGSVTKYLRLKSLQYPSSVTGGLTGGIAHYNYGAANDGLVLSRLDNIADDDAGSTQYVAYDYFGTSSVFKVTHPTVTNGLTLDYDTGAAKTYAGFDNLGRVVKQRWQNNSADRDHYEYGYDYNGNRLYRKNIVNTAHSELYHADADHDHDDYDTPDYEMPGYDGLDRLKVFRRGTLHANNDKISTLTAYQTYTLDSTGNWTTFDDNGTSQARTHNAANEISTIAVWQDPTFDDAGNMTAGPKPGSGATKQQYVYDGWNRLVEVQDAGDVVVAQYRYDGLHRRIRKYLMEDNGQPEVDTWTVFEYYYSNKWQVLEVCFGTNYDRGESAPYTEPGVPTSVTEQNLWDARYVDALAVRWCDHDSDGDFNDTNNELYPTHDANFNITALVDTSGTVQERYEYDAYGVVRYMTPAFGTRTSSSFDNPYLYTGRRLDPDTGLYHYRNRDYDAYLARFTARDKEGYNAGDMNLYAYVGGSPVGWTDPHGTQKKLPFNDDKFDLGTFSGDIDKVTQVKCNCYKPKDTSKGTACDPSMLTKPTPKQKTDFETMLTSVKSKSRAVQRMYEGIRTACGDTHGRGVAKVEPRCFAGACDGLKGFYWVPDGTVYINVNDVTTEAELESILLHELTHNRQFCTSTMIKAYNKAPKGKLPCATAITKEVEAYFAGGSSFEDAVHWAVGSACLANHCQDSTEILGIGNNLVKNIEKTWKNLVRRKRVQTDKQNSSSDTK